MGPMSRNVMSIRGAGPMSSESSTARWLQLLPLRWAVGGLILGVVWLLVSSALLGSFNYPEGGLIPALIRVGLVIVLPLAVLGLIWGYSERLKLTQSASQGRDILAFVVKGTMRRQIGKAALCGLAFGLYVRVLHPLGEGFSWNVVDEFVRALSSMILALPVGLAVGHFFRRDLYRRFGDVAKSPSQPTRP